MTTTTATTATTRVTLTTGPCVVDACGDAGETCPACGASVCEAHGTSGGACDCDAGPVEIDAETVSALHL